MGIRLLIADNIVVIIIKNQDINIAIIYNINKQNIILKLYANIIRK